MIEFNDLLIKSEIAPKDVLIMRHRPTETGLRRVLPWYAAERPELFNAYQCIQGTKNAEIALSRAKFLASFIGIDPGRAHFVGLFRQLGSKLITAKEFSEIPENKELQTQGLSLASMRESGLWFDLVLEEKFSDLMGRLVISWTGIERSWYRWANRNYFPVLAINEENGFLRGMPDWVELNLSWQELQSLPSAWRKRIAEWRGIYLITDVADGKQYVGSAGGKENIMGRWQNYASSGHGSNKLLIQRNPKTFRFSILQRVSPDLDLESLVRMESSWKERLHTRLLGLNSN